MPHLKLLEIIFDFELAVYEVPAFRGAVIEHVGREHVAFNNHHGDTGFIYKYPNIQYKRIGRQAAIICINDGIDDIYQLFSQQEGDIRIGERKVNLSTKRINVQKPLVQVWDKPFVYKLTSWLGLNTENHKTYMGMLGMREKLEFIERLITANILSFAKGINWTVDRKIEVNLSEMIGQKQVTYKGVKLIAFELVFSTNVFLPWHIGLGKGASTGFGVIYPVRNFHKAEQSIAE